MTLRTLGDASAFFRDTLAAHPERDALAAETAVCAGVPRPHACFYLSHLHIPDDRSEAPTLFALPPHEFPDTEEGRLARGILSALLPLDMLNPVGTVLGAGVVGTPAEFVLSFGTPLSEDRGAAAYASPIAEVLRRPPPDPDTAPPMPEIRRRIQFLRSTAPGEFRIGLPDFQGSFNLAHALCGNDAFLAPLTDPESWDRLMTRITDFWIAAHERLLAWIGPERLRPIERRGARLAECSVNLVSPEFYRDYILPYDLRIARHFGAVRIPPCSGRHVFKATLDGLPGVYATEAGLMRSPMAAACISVPEALEWIGGRTIALSVGQELPPDFSAAAALIRADFARARSNPRLLFGYTGMDWRKRDRPAIRDLHRRLDAEWPFAGLK